MYFCFFVSVFSFSFFFFSFYFFLSVILFWNDFQHACISKMYYGLIWYTI